MVSLEIKIEQKVCREALRLGVRNLKLNVQGQTGWPDRIFLIPGGKPLFVEFKRPGGKIRPKQEYIHQVLWCLGYQTEIHDDPALALQAIKHALDATRLSEEGGKVPPRACGKRAVPRSRTGENVNHTGGNQTAQAEEVS